MAEKLCYGRAASPQMHTMFCPQIHTVFSRFKLPIRSNQPTDLFIKSTRSCRKNDWIFCGLRAHSSAIYAAEVQLLLDSKEPAGLGGIGQTARLFLFYFLHLKDIEGEMRPAQGRECPLLSRRSPASSHCTEPFLPLLISDGKRPEIKLNSSISCPCAFR